MSGWTEVFRHRGPIDPDHGGPATVVRMDRDNLGGLVLWIDEGDGAKVAGVPLPAEAVLDLHAALTEHLSAP